MALRWRVSAVPQSTPQSGGPDIVHWQEAQVLITVQVYDDATPATTILTKNYVFPHDRTNQQMTDAITADLSRLKTAQARWAGLQSSIGSTFPIP